MVELDLLAVDDQAIGLDGSGTLEEAVCRVVLEHVLGVVGLNEGVVDGDNVDTTVVDAVEQLERLSHAMWGRGATHALRKT